MEGEQMAGQPTDQNPLQGEQMYTPAKKGISAGLVVLIVVLTMGVSGAGAWYYVNSKATTEKNNLQNQISDLEKEVATLKAAETTTSSTTSTTATTDATKDWKTYTNSTYGFSFKYPTTWEVRDLTAVNSNIANLKLFVGANPTSNKEDTWFSVQVKDSTLASELSKITSGKKDTQKFGLAATAVTTTNSTTGISSTTYYLVKNSLLYIVAGETTDTSANATIGNQILSTFQFTS